MKSKYPLIECHFFSRPAKKRISPLRLKRLLESLFKKFAKNAELKKRRAKNGLPDLSVVFVSAAKMKKLNFSYRKKNYATDILSFAPAARGEGLGELVMCEGVLTRQAGEQGHSLKKEVDYMLIHGFLHLLGYDHEKSRKEELKMMALQAKLWASLSKK